MRIKKNKCPLYLRNKTNNYSTKENILREVIKSELRNFENEKSRFDIIGISLVSVYIIALVLMFLILEISLGYLFIQKMYDFYSMELSVFIGFELSLVIIFSLLVYLECILIKQIRKIKDFSFFRDLALFIVTTYSLIQIVILLIKFFS